VIEVRAVAVVDGATLVIAEPSIEEMFGSRPLFASISAHPRPSRTKSTTLSAPFAGTGSQVAGRVPRRAGMIPAIDAPAKSGLIGSIPLTVAFQMKL
jgi:hypothetical protein